MDRKFTSGSRQTPDPYDQFLEQHNFYRKHTARDSTALFRVISEQMYDTQLHHLEIRKKCVAYMREYREYFESQIKKDYDEYLDDLAKPNAYGTMIELQAVSYMYRRSVVVFEPFNLGNYLNEYQANLYEIIRVFYTPEGHFDSVFTKDYIEDLAMCQSLLYEILYRDVFKLPDIRFAVEKMLHPTSFENDDCEIETNEDGYNTRIILPDGRQFQFDLPQNTNCILTNYKFCHFHSPDFLQLSDDLQKQVNNFLDGSGESTQSVRTKQQPFLPDKYISCVRQLLREGITPFPYKVAKALDPHMYRNVEFDSWNEVRKELRFVSWYNNEPYVKVGSKCCVKLLKSDKDTYTCHVQEVSPDRTCCVVYIEELGERRLVPLDALSPLPINHIQPWLLPYGLQRQVRKYHSLRITDQFNYGCKYYHDTYQSKAFMKRNIKQYTRLEDYHLQSLQYCVMPLTTNRDPTNDGVRNRSENGNVDGNGNIDNSVIHNAQELSHGFNENHGVVACNMSTNSGGQPRNVYTSSVGDGRMNRAASYTQEPHNFYVSSQQGFVDEHHYGYYDNTNVHVPPTQTQPFVPLYNGMMHAQYYPLYNGQMPTAINGAPIRLAMVPHQSHPIMYPSPNNAIPPLMAGNYPNACINQPVAAGSLFDQQLVLANENRSHSSTHFPNVNDNRTVNQHNGELLRINYDVKKSVNPNGSDLPTDVATLRFFFNLGIDYYNQSSQYKVNEGTTGPNYSYGNNVQKAQCVDTSKLNENFNQMKFNKFNNNNMNNNNNINNNNNANNNNKPFNMDTKTVNEGKFKCYNNNNNNNHDNKQNQKRFNRREFQQYHQVPNIGNHHSPNAFVRPNKSYHSKHGPTSTPLPHDTQDMGRNQPRDGKQINNMPQQLHSNIRANSIRPSPTHNNEFVEKRNPKIYPNMYWNAPRFPAPSSLSPHVFGYHHNNNTNKKNVNNNNNSRQQQMVTSVNTERSKSIPLESQNKNKGNNSNNGDVPSNPKDEDKVSKNRN